MAAGWSTVTLDKIIDVKHGYAFPGEHIRENPTRDILLTPGNFEIGGGFKAEKFKYYDGEVPEEYVLEEGDLLVTMTDLSKQSDTLGFPALIPKADGARFLHNQRVGRILIKPNAGVDKRFLYYLLRSAEYRHEVLASATGTSIKHTSPSRILAYKANLPGLAEQRAISHILGTLDDKIELNRKMNQTLEAMARAIFKSWFVDFDPVRAKAEGREPGLPRDLAALFPDSFEDSGLGEIPKGWRVQRVGDVGKVICGKTPATKVTEYYGKDIPFITIPDMHGNVFATTTQKNLSRAGEASQENKTLPAGTICVSCIATPGLVVITTEESQTNQQINSITPSAENETYYWFWIFRNSGDAIRSGGSGGSVLANLSTGRFTELHVLAPPARLRNAYHLQVSALFSRVLANEREIKNLATMRDALLPKLLSGELSVKEAERVADSGQIGLTGRVGRGWTA